MMAQREMAAWAGGEAVEPVTAGMRAVLRVLGDAERRLSVATVRVALRRAGLTQTAVHEALHLLRERGMVVGRREGALECSVELVVTDAGWRVLGDPPPWRKEAVR